MLPPRGRGPPDRGDEIRAVAATERGWAERLQAAEEQGADLLRRVRNLELALQQERERRTTEQQQAAAEEEEE